MKGISPVIATVLLLLMSVAAVGGSWLWYQRQSSSVSGTAEEKLSNQIDQQKAASVSLASIYLSGGKIVLLINNAGENNVTLTGYKIDIGSSANVNNSISKTLIGRKTTQLATIVSCTSGSTAKIRLFMQGLSTQEFTETC